MSLVLRSQEDPMAKASQINRDNRRKVLIAK